TLAELINPDERRLNLRQLKRLAATPWRDEPSNVHVLAPTGAGKTYIACAIGIAACQAEYSVAYYRLDQLVDELAAFPPADERYVAKMRRLQNIDVLILDDFLTIGINQRGQEDLTKIIFDRDGRLPTIIVSQTTAAYWIKKLPDPVGADSLVSRLNAGQRIELGDYDMRQHLAHAQTTVDS
ncbi:TPA: ATP-binding protein, partial [Corynebacterium striatum]